jgi:hypothetical protein
VKLGTDNKLETLAAVVLGLGAVLSVGYWLMSSGSANTSGTTTEAKAPVTKTLINPLDPTIRVDLLESAQDVKFESKGRRNIFVPGAPEIPEPNTPPLTRKPNPGLPPNPGPPPPPPINLKFFGVASRAGEAQKVFLSEGESIFVAHEGDIVNSRYKVVKINPQSVEIEDLLNNNRQSIPLTQG